MCAYIYIYIYYFYLQGRQTESFCTCLTPQARRAAKLIGWSNNRFNNLHFNMSLETQFITACVAECSLRFCDLFKHRLLKG